jgi:hypothetical protein
MDAAWLIPPSVKQGNEQLARIIQPMLADVAQTSQLAHDLVFAVRAVSGTPHPPGAMLRRRRRVCHLIRASTGLHALAWRGGPRSRHGPRRGKMSDPRRRRLVWPDAAVQGRRCEPGGAMTRDAARRSAGVDEARCRRNAGGGSKVQRDRNPWGIFWISA